MDAFMKKLGRLAALARDASPPRPLDAAGVMARIRDLSREDETVLSMPFRFFAGGAAAAAAVAAVAALLAVSAWNEMNSPLGAIDSMFNVMEVL